MAVATGIEIDLKSRDKRNDFHINYDCTEALCLRTYGKRGGGICRALVFAAVENGEEDAGQEQRVGPKKGQQKTSSRRRKAGKVGGQREKHV